ncbi:MAG: adenylosuccinase ade13 [Vezdaea acicularis]|nr:MAG: adenylosuccinase ade13 [Vezdaea acicularis]
MSVNDTYQSPLSSRYASKEMSFLFSLRNRFTTWRKLWLWLAESEQELGVTDITDEALQQMREKLTVTDEDLVVAAEEEKRRRHDVMAHVHAYGQVAPAAAGFIHYGATSCYVTDNADLIFLRDGLDILLPRLATIMKKLSDFAIEHKDLPCLAYTHGQPAQLTTVGKRTCLWLQDLLINLRNLERARDDLRFRGVKGTTGTQASFLQIFHGSHAKVEALDELVTKKAGFASAYTITSQTYSRIVDLQVANALSVFGDTCQRIGGDIRHLAAFKEMEEPFEPDQIGSSAMAYKRNPMRSERMCSMGRMLANINKNASNTYAAQWFERTLDDSAIRRMMLPDMFLLADILCSTMNNVVSGLVLYPAVINKRIAEELPFMATENIIMRLVALSHSRQTAHEHLRQLSHQASARVKQHGAPNDLLARIRADPFFAPIVPELDALTDPKSFIGRAPQQVEKFVREELEERLQVYREALVRDEVVKLSV